MAIYYYILLLVGCGFIASPITMVCIYIFYWIYVHNIQTAFTYNIVSEWYRELEKDHIVQTTTKEQVKLLDKSGKSEVEMALLDNDKELKEGGEDDEEMFFWPMSWEVGLEDIERRWTQT